MNYKSLYLPLTLLFLYGCGLAEVPVDQLSYKNGLKVLKESGEPFTGKSIRFEGGEIPSEIVEYKDGKLDGNIQFFYANGEIKEAFSARVINDFYMLIQGFGGGKESNDTRELDELALKSLVRYGKEHKWYDNGEMQSEGLFSDDGSRKIGEWKWWYKNGERKEEGEYSSDITLPMDSKNRRRRDDVKGIKIGEWNRWYENGEKAVELVFNNDKKESVQLYCENGTLGYQMLAKESSSLVPIKIWDCAGKEFILSDSDNREAQYFQKKAVGSSSLMSEILKSIEKGSYAINADDYYKKSAVETKDGQAVGLMTEWDEKGNIVLVKDYDKANFIDPEYLEAFLKKGRFGSYYKINYSSKKWSVDRFNFKSAKPDIEATQLYLQRKLVDPAKKIAINHSSRDIFGKPKKDQGISHWTYPVIVAPEALFDVIKVYSGVKLDSVDSDGRNRLHLCAILMLGSKPDRCSMEHFEFLVKSIPVNETDKSGMTALNYVAESFHSRRSVRSRNRKGTDDKAIKALGLLVKAGADINHTNAQGQTALMSALSYQEYKIAKAILDLGADINIKDNEGHNALYFVFFQRAKNTWSGGDKVNFKLSKKTKAILTVLAENSLKPDEQDINGKSVKDMALKSGAITTVQFLETLSEIKPIEKIVKTVSVSDVAVEGSLNNSVVDSTQPSEPGEVKQLELIQAIAETTQTLPENKVSIAVIDTVTATPVLEVEDVDQELVLYQKALSQIKKSRLSRPKGNSALDTLKQLSALTSEDDANVKVIRQKIVDKYLSLARGRINDSRYQDAVRFIKTSQRIQSSKKATQLMARVEDKIAEERLFQQQQQQQQQQQKINAARQAPPVQEKSSLGALFKSIFN